MQSLVKSKNNMQLCSGGNNWNDPIYVTDVICALEDVGKLKWTMQLRVHDV
jgi:hypothetical protein